MNVYRDTGRNDWLDDTNPALRAGIETTMIGKTLDCETNDLKTKRNTSYNIEQYVKQNDLVDWTKKTKDDEQKTILTEHHVWTEWMISKSTNNQTKINRKNKCAKETTLGFEFYTKN